MIMMPTNPSYKRGDVVLVLFPHSDLRTAKLRPALIVQADNLDTGFSQAIVVVITSNMLRANHSSRLPVFLSHPEGKKSGLLTDSVIMTDNIATVIDKAIERIIGTFPMEKVDAALRYTLGL